MSGKFRSDFNRHAHSTCDHCGQKDPSFIPNSLFDNNAVGCDVGDYFSYKRSSILHVDLLYCDLCGYTTYPTKEDNERTCEGKQTIGDCYRHLVKNHINCLWRADESDDRFKMGDDIIYPKIQTEFHGYQDIYGNNDRMKKFHIPNHFYGGSWKKHNKRLIINE